MPSISDAVRSITETASTSPDGKTPLSEEGISISSSFIELVQQEIMLGVQGSATDPDAVPEPTITPVPEPETLTANVRLGCCTAAEPDISNCCGQVAIGTVLSAFGHEFTAEELCAMNPSGLFTAPSSVVEFLNCRVGAIQHNNGTLQDLKRALDNGNPVVTLIDMGGEPHWVTITGYRTDANGNMTHLEIRDQAINGNGDGTTLMPCGEFEHMWANPLEGMGSAFTAITGYHNLWIETGTRGNVFTAHSFDTAAEDLAASGINRVVRGWQNGTWSELLHGVNELCWSVPSLLLTVPGAYLSSAGGSMISWGAERWEEGGFLNSVAGGASWVSGHIVHGAGKVLGAVGDGIATVGRGISSGARAVRDFVVGLWPF